MSDPILANLLFTKSVGRRDDTDDSTFNDAINYGGFPADFKITGIRQIDLFSDRNASNAAFITGIAVQYDGINKTIRHGVVNVDNVGTITIDPKKEIIVGVFGQLKELPEHSHHKHVASIGFVLLDSANGRVRVHGPFYGTSENQGTPFSSFGPIVAFQGTTKDGIGLTTLGFVKTLGESPNHVEILQKKVGACSEKSHCR